MVIDQEYLERLRAQAQEIREDLEERELRCKDDLEHIMAVTAPLTRSEPLTTIVHKTIDNARQYDMPEDMPVYDAALPFSEEQMDAMAQVIADLRTDIQGMIDQANAPLRERIAMLEGQVNTLLQMLGGDTNKSIPRLSVMK
jgi:hypothetical protein